MTNMIEKTKVKVHVTLVSDKSFFAYMYLEPGQRVQDVVNDDRSFIPFDKFMHDREPKTTDIWKVIVVNKTQISTIEER